MSSCCEQEGSSISSYILSKKSSLPFAFFLSPPQKEKCYMVIQNLGIEDTSITCILS